MEVLTEHLGLYLDGFFTTIALSLLSFAAAMVLGTVVAAARVSPVAPARGAGLVFVELIRNTPLLVLFVIFVFGFPKIGVIYPLFTSSVIVLSVYTGAFISETLRSGINSVAAGQAEAARSIGLTFGQTLRLVVLPQAFRTVVQPLGNLFIALTKNSSLAATVAVVELVGAADKVNTEAARPLVAFGIAGVLYLSLTLPSGLLVGLIERRVAIKR